MLQRHITQQVLDDLSFFPVIGIVGPRQVGKTTLAKYVQEKLPLQSLYLDLELETDTRRLDDAETFLKFHQDKCIIIDEVQRMPRLFPLIRALVDMDRRPARFILLGSASPDIIKDSSETLAGRIAYTELTPFSWLEVKHTCSLNDHWFKGGFPTALLATRTSNTRRWLKNFIETFIHRDLQELGQKTSPDFVRKILEMLGHLSGNILNIATLSRSLTLSNPTIHRYLDLLEGSFIISRLDPYHINITKRLVKAPKIYIRDSGILHSINNITTYDQLLGHPSVGASFESYVIEQIRRVAGNEWKFYFYRTHTGAETDLVLVSPSGKKTCVEIKLSNSASISRGFFESCQDITPDFSFVITPNGASYPSKNGVITCGLDEFLEQHLND